MLAPRDTRTLVLISDTPSAQVKLLQKFCWMRPIPKRITKGNKGVKNQRELQNLRHDFELAAKKHVLPSLIPFESITLDKTIDLNSLIPCSRI